MSFFKNGQVQELLFALGILSLGTLIAFLIKRISYKILSRRSSKSSHFLTSLFSTQQLYRFTIITSNLLFWATLIYSLSLALKPFGVHFLQGLGEQVVAYLPVFFKSLFILFVGISLAKICSKVIHDSNLGVGAEAGGNISRIVYFALVSITILIATDHLGIDIHFLTSILLVLLASLLGGGALSFGIGSASLVTSILASYYLKQIIKVGQTIESEDISGRIIEINHTSVLIQTDKGTEVLSTKEMNNKRFRITNA